MPFSLQVISATGGTYSLSAGTPYSLEQATGLWMAPVRRLTEQGPYQDGDTDRGYRLDPRTATIALNFAATSGSALDTYRDTLLSIFRPSTSTPLKLRVTRDDGAVRQLDCYTVGPVDLPLVKEYKPGNLHRAVVQLRAADPGWYDATPGTATVTGTAALNANWYTANGLIGTANVMEYGQTPSINQAWTYTGTLSAYTIAVRAAPWNTSGTGFVFAVSSPGVSGSITWDNTSIAFGRRQDFGLWINSRAVSTVDPVSGGAQMDTTRSYFMVCSGTVVKLVKDNRIGMQLSDYDPNTGRFNNSDRSYMYYSNDVWPLSGTARRWRTNNTFGTAGAWDGSVPLYAVYNKALSDTELRALAAYMDQSIGGSVLQTLTVPYSGNLPEYPTISITGPITSPVITNTTTGETLSFGTNSIGAGTTYTVNLAYGQKSVTVGTANRLYELTAASDLITWHLAPSPLAAGGTNVITVSGTLTGTATQVRIVYYNRYTEF